MQQGASQTLFSGRLPGTPHARRRTRNNFIFIFKTGPRQTFIGTSIAKTNSVLPAGPFGKY
jgi:hypothetical protein